MLLAVGLCIGLILGLVVATHRQRRAPQPPPVPTVDQRDMLAAIVDHAPSATIVLDDNGLVRYSNAAASALFFAGEVPANASLSELVRNSSEPLRRALAADRTEIMVLGTIDEQTVHQVTKRTMEGPDATVFTVLTAHPLTDELLREEVRSYKKLLRVLSHELNNSLAPVASLATTGKRLLEHPGAGELQPILDTIIERVEHLRTFLGRYAALARLPKPRCSDVALAPLLTRIARLFPGVQVSTPTTTAWVDEVQLEQLIVNLVKNALEAGSAAVDVSIAAEVNPTGGMSLTVSDAGSGLTDEVLASALIPFFSTKPGGSGLGLAICREIVEGHGGRLRLRNRHPVGAEAVVRLPGRAARIETPASWTFTRP